MKTGLDMVQIGYQLINQPDVHALLSGSIFKLQRPQRTITSTESDIVINPLALPNKQYQEGVFNVNIHVPNLQNVVIGGKPDNTQPDIAAMNSIAAAVIPKLDNVWGDDYHLDCQTSGLPIQDSDGTWYLNIRVNFYSIQQNFKNI